MSKNPATEIVAKTEVIRFWRSLSNSLSSSGARLFGVIAALLYICLAGVHLTAQGLYYDELHQAPAAFAYKGVHPEFITYLSAGRVPLLNMTYSGALKSNIYGIYLKLFHASFSVVSWRLCGLLFVAGGLILFCVLARRGFSRGGLLVFAALFLTDTTVLLETRHDWGPVALALMLRLIFIGLWIQGEMEDQLSPQNSFLLALIVGISLFEKLSNIVLVLPMLLLLVVSERRRARPQILACLRGGVTGVLPLLLINLFTYAKHHFFISLLGAAAGHGAFRALPTVTTGSSQSFPAGPFQFLSNYLSLGSGTLVRAFILGARPITTATYVELALMLTLLFSLAFLVQRRWHQNRHLAMAGTLMLCYLAVAIGLKLLPRSTYMHHWIIGTPFQYAAFALGVVGLQREKFAAKRRITASSFTFCAALCFLCASRIVSLFSLETALLRGDSSIAWAHSHTELGEFAKAHAHNAFFIASDWGITTPIYCFANGQPHLVYEVFWNNKPLQEVQRIVASNSKSVFYMAGLTPSSNIEPHNTIQLEQEIGQLPGWHEVPVENEVAHLRGIHVRKFVRNN